MIKKKLLHFNSFADFSRKKLSANKDNTQYRLGLDGEVKNGTPDIMWQSVVYVLENLIIWTHGSVYSDSALAEKMKIVSRYVIDGVDGETLNVNVNV